MVQNAIKLIFEQVEASGQWNPFIDHLADEVEFSRTIPDDTPIRGIFRGKREVENYLTRILPGVTNFKQEAPTQFISKDNRGVILGDDSYTLTSHGVISEAGTR